MEIQDGVLKSIKLKYLELYNTKLKELEEIKFVLSKLNGFVIEEEIKFDETNISVEPSKNNKEAVLANNSAEIENTEVSVAIAKEEAEVEKPKRAYKKRAKKRGRKSVWGTFVMKRLRSVNRPLTYDDLTNHAIVNLNLDPSEYEKSRKAIIGAVFQLRNKQQKLQTHNKSNSRDKYVLLNKWFDEEGKPLPQMKAYME